MAKVIACVFLLVAVILHNKAVTGAPMECDDETLSKCFDPALAYMKSEEGADLPKLIYGFDLNDTRLVETLCKVGPVITTCLNDFVDRCVARDADEFHEFLDATVKLMEICKAPAVQTLAHQAYGCLKAINVPNTKFRKCAADMTTFIVNVLQNTIQMLKDALDTNSTAPLVAWQGEKVVEKTCCGLDLFRRCMGFDGQAECDSNAAALNSQFFDAIFTAYNCEENIAACDNTADVEKMEPVRQVDAKTW